jgi:hypothetical protein
MRRRTRIRRSLSLLGTARLELARGSAAALLGELTESKAHGKRAGRLIFEAIREAECAHVFSPAPHRYDGWQCVS